MNSPWKEYKSKPASRDGATQSLNDEREIGFCSPVLHADLWDPQDRSYNCGRMLVIPTHTRFQQRRIKESGSIPRGRWRQA